MFWKLQGTKPIPTTLSEWADDWNAPDRRLWVDTIGTSEVRTGFFGSDPFVLSGEYREPQLLFATTINNRERAAYPTYTTAEAGHRQIVKELKEGIEHS